MVSLVIVATTVSVAVEPLLIMPAGRKGCVVISMTRSTLKVHVKLVNGELIAVGAVKIQRYTAPLSLAAVSPTAIVKLVPVSPVMS